MKPSYIIKTICDYLQVEETDIRRKCKRARVAKARRYIMYFIKLINGVRHIDICRELRRECPSQVTHAINITLLYRTL